MIGTRFSEEQHYFSKSGSLDQYQNPSYSQKEGREDLFKRAG